jgi:hypothetical protein
MTRKGEEMPTNKAVVDLVERWSGKRPKAMNQNLEDWWGETAPGSNHSTLAYDKEGIESLVDEASETFPKSPSLTADDFRAAGNIKTLQDLVDALQPPMTIAATAAFLARDRKAGPAERLREKEADSRSAAKPRGKRKPPVAKKKMAIATKKTQVKSSRGKHQAKEEVTKDPLTGRSRPK